MLAHQLNLHHPCFGIAQQPLVKLAEAIDWPYFEQQFGPVASGEAGRLSLPVRLMVGLHYLKALYDESDATVVSKWVENPYWQYFCGEECFQHELPCHLTSLVKRRQRVGPEGVKQLLKQVLRVAPELCRGAQPNRRTAHAEVSGTTPSVWKTLQGACSRSYNLRLKTNIRFFRDDYLGKLLNLLYRN